MVPRAVAVVPHTHWDREWYEPFQSFRLRLVELLDALVPLMESDPSYARFMLDGQMAVVDDYLEVRPEAEARLRALVIAGRLTVGPWYILMDEFLVSAETIVRDLQMGIASGARFGGVMEVGYLPDMFGHVAQMPQILRQAGLHHAVVWRGAPSAVNRTGFWWQAPDGSEVRAEYLPVGYSNGAALPADPKALVRRVADHVEEIGSYLGDGPLLVMNGTDHQAPQPWLGHVVAEANALQDDLRLQVTSLVEYLQQAPTDGLPRWCGELRSGFRANILMGVASNRVDVKQAAARAERALERRAEPAAALVLGDQWPAALLALAWRQMVRNAAHDSVCACSVDDVVDAVLVRYAEARQIAEGITTRALAALARSLARRGPTVVNLAGRPLGGVVELTLPGDGVPEGTQAVPDQVGGFGIPQGLGAITLDASTVRTILGMLPNGSRIDDHTWIQDVTLGEDDTGLDVTITVGPEERADVPVVARKQELYTRLGARPDAVVRIRIDQPATVRVLARTPTVPAFGWAPWELQAPAHPVHAEQHAGGSVTVANGLVTVTVDPDDGTFAVDGVAGFGRLVDGGDHGDSYNYSPPATDQLVDHPEEVTVSLDAAGPVRAVVTVVARYRWPERVDGTTRRRTGEQPVTVTTTVRVDADAPDVHVTTRFTNPCRDHRLRVHLPLPEPAATSRAECAFAVVERGLTAEGRPDELGLPTFPSRRFVCAGGLTVAHEGLLEYELIDIAPDGEGPAAAHTLALTLLRATGMLSRLGMAYRPLPAGPLTPVEGLQLLGQALEARYTLDLSGDDPYAVVDRAFLPVEVVHASGGGWRPLTGSLLPISGAEISAVRREGDLLEVRVFNPRPEPVDVDLAGRSGWLVDLRGRPLQAVQGQVALGPFAFATVRLTAVEQL